MSARDTTPDAEAFRTQLLRKMTPGQRCALAADMSIEARAFTLAGIHGRHPDYDDAQAQMALFRLVLGDALFCRAYPTAPLLAP